MWKILEIKTKTRTETLKLHQKVDGAPELKSSIA